MMKKIEIEGGLSFVFNDFISAEAVDRQDGKDKARLKFNGTSIVDVIAENNEQLCFIEAKNFIRASADTNVQIAMDKAREHSYAELADAPAYAKKMLGKLEHSLFLWLASGNSIRKPVAFILAFVVDPVFDSNLRRILIDRLNKYIPNPSYNPLQKSGENETKIYFDIPEVYDNYGFSVSVQQVTSENARIKA
ncbi:hypothetical protein FACS189479_08960 [Spirochaetia bacterium]|nr:hypothetical protein FACS189479_08960 [Spirochaetia bacterium]